MPTNPGPRTDRRRTETRRYGDPCGIARALDAVGERWALLVVRELGLGPRRFGQLRTGLPDVSPNVLSQRLRELEDDGIVRRYRLAPPADVSAYELTPRGYALGPVLDALGRWGAAMPRISGRELSPSSLLAALRTMFDPDHSSPSPVTYGLRLRDDPFGLSIADGRIEVTRGLPVDAAATLATDVTTLRMIAFLGTGVRAAEDSGALTITGDRRAAARFPKYFRRPQ